MSYHPSGAVSWIREIEAQDINDLRAFFSFTGTRCPNFEKLDTKIAALKGTRRGTRTSRRELEQHEEDFKRAIQNMEVRKIATLFETVQAQISDLKYRDHEIYGLEEQLDWSSGHWRNYSLLDHRFTTQFGSKVNVFSDSLLCLGGKCQEHLEAAKTLGKRPHQRTRPKPRMPTILRHDRKTNGIPC